MIGPKTEREAERERMQKIDRPWREYPIGTKAVAYNGGHWLRIEDGWKWNPHGSTFPTPGADAAWVILPEEAR